MAPTLMNKNKSQKNNSEFVKPEDLKNILSKNNLKIEKIDGMNFDIFKDEWNISKDISINYIAKSSKV